MQRIAFIEHDGEDHRVFDLFNKDLVNKFRAIMVTNFEELLAEHQRNPIQGIVLNWDLAKYPTYFFERVMQDPEFSALPTVVFHSKMQPAEVDFLKEYKFTYLVNTANNTQRAVQDIDDFLTNEYKGRAKEVREIIASRKFFNRLHSGKFSEAVKVVNEELVPISTKLELVYYRGLVLKMQKQFDDSVKFLAHGMNISHENRNLDTRFLHLLGNVFFKVKSYDQALSFLEAAEKVSSRNLRRKFILGQLHFENGDHEQALQRFLEIHDVCPIYPGINSRIVDIKYNQSQSNSDIDKLSSFLGEISGRKLVKTYKTLQGRKPPELERRLLDIVIREFSKYAEQLIGKKDYYGALKYYNHIKKIVEPNDVNRNKILLFCYARLYVKAGDYTMAERYIGKITDLDPEPNVKVKKLLHQIAIGREKRHKRALAKMAS